MRRLRRASVRSEAARACRGRLDPSSPVDSTRRDNVKVYDNVAARLRLSPVARAVEIPARPTLEYTQTSPGGGVQPVPCARPRVTCDAWRGQRRGTVFVYGNFGARRRDPRTSNVSVYANVPRRSQGAPLGERRAAQDCRPRPAQPAESATAQALPAKHARSTAGPVALLERRTHAAPSLTKRSTVYDSAGVPDVSSARRSPRLTGARPDHSPRGRRLP